MQKRKVITQAQAAREWLPLPCKRQRINELIKAGRFTTPVDDKGNERKGCVYLDEVLNFQEKPKGRPRLTKEVLESRGLVGFEIGDNVIWFHTPKDGYGYFIRINGTVLKTGTKRLKLKLETPDGEQIVWANRTDCVNWKPRITDFGPRGRIRDYQL